MSTPGVVPQGAPPPADVDPAVWRLAGALHALRRNAKVGLDEFTRTTGVNRIRVTAIETGRSVPDRDMIHAYFQIAPDLGDAERRMIRRLHDAAERATASPSDDTEKLIELAEQRHRPAGVVQVGDVTFVPPGDGVQVKIAKPAFRQSVSKSQADPAKWPDPADIETVEQFVNAMGVIKASTAMSYQALARESTADKYPLARSTVHAMCTRKKLPTNPQAVRTFIQICGGTPVDIERWAAAWQRLAQTEKDRSTDPPFAEWIAELGNGAATTEPGRSPELPLEAGSITSAVITVGNRLDYRTWAGIFLLGFLCGAAVITGIFLITLR